MYELFYSTGGHGGPYGTLFDAKVKALRLLAGNPNEQFIDVQAKGTGFTVARITRNHLESFDAMGQTISTALPTGW
jgi:hypothetical protein